MSNLLTLGVVFAVTALAGIALIATQHWHGYFSMDGLEGVQKHHTQPTPRVGGVAIASGLAVAWAVAPPEMCAILGPLLVAALPAFVFGLVEDCTKRVSVRTRLLATMFSGVLAWTLTGVAMQDTGVPPLDWLLRFTPMAVLFTAFTVGGVANAVNIIDGFNGLASGAVAIMFAALGIMSFSLGDTTLAAVCILMVAISLGFFTVNWPMGKIFLGDGGAYLLGFLLAWVAVLLPMRSPLVNGWATMLVCAYPVLEVGFSVWRRHKRPRGRAGHPDKAHLHHLIHRRIVRKLFPQLCAELQNGMTSPLCWAYCVLPTGWAVLFSKNTVMLVLGFLLSILTYVAIYTRLTQFRWSLVTQSLLRKPNVKPLFEGSPH